MQARELSRVPPHGTRMGLSSVMTQARGYHHGVTGVTRVAALRVDGQVAPFLPGHQHEAESPDVQGDYGLLLPLTQRGKEPIANTLPMRPLALVLTAVRACGSVFRALTDTQEIASRVQSTARIPTGLIIGVAYDATSAAILCTRPPPLLPCASQSHACPCGLCSFPCPRPRSLSPLLPPGRIRAGDVEGQETRDQYCPTTCPREGSAEGGYEEKHP
jgi:hypothetical protein